MPYIVSKHPGKATLLNYPFMSIDLLLAFREGPSAANSRLVKRGEGDDSDANKKQEFRQRDHSDPVHEVPHSLWCRVPLPHPTTIMAITAKNE